MGWETEKFYEELQKYVNESNTDSEEGLRRKIQEFLEQHAADAADEDFQPDVYDYLKMAADASDKEEAEKFIRNALRLDPDSLDAQYALFSIHGQPDAASQAELEALLKKGEAQLEKEGITRERCAGEYHIIHETRSYLAVYKGYVDLLIAEGKIRKAVDACKDILYLNNNDNMGVRYTLMALYAQLEERETAEALYQTYPEESICMLLPLIALYYRLEDTAQASKYLAVMARHLKNLKKELNNLAAMSSDEIDDVLNAPFYQPFSAEELCVAYGEGNFVYMALPDFIPWMISQLPSRSSRKKKT